MNLLLPAILWIVTLVTCDAKDIMYFDGSLAETSSLPLKLECKKPYTYIYVGSVTYNGTAMSQAQTTAATDECVKQSEQQSGKGGALITCFLTFGKTFSTDDSLMIRAVYKCLTSKPEKKPGGKEWAKQSYLHRTVLTSKPNSKGKVKFACSGVKDLVEVVKILQEGEEIETNLQKYKELVKRDCYIQSAKAISKGLMVPLECFVQFNKEDTYELEVQYRCEDPPVDLSGKQGVTIIV